MGSERINPNWNYLYRVTGKDRSSLIYGEFLPKS